MKQESEMNMKAKTTKTKPATTKDPAAQEERKAKAKVRRDAFEVTFNRLRENESVWTPFVALHAAIKALPTPEERLRARLAKLEAQRQKLEAQLTGGA
jgi:hypothetical protein